MTLRRHTRLRARGGLRARGRRAERLQPWRDANMDGVRRSTRICALCKLPGYIDVHHVFGRNNIIGEPLASHPDFLAGVCRPCHARITNPHVEKDRQDQLKLQWEALARIKQTFDLVFPCRIGSKSWVPIDLARQVERELDDDEIYASVA